MGRHARSWSVAAAILVLAAGLMACGTGGNGGQNGNGDDNGNGVTDGSDVGFLYVSEETTVASGFEPLDLAVEVNAFGAFLRLDTAPPTDFFTDPWSGIAGTCEVSTLADLPDDPIDLPLPIPEDLEFTFLDAGETIMITAGDDPYLLLDRLELMDFVFYVPEEAIEGTLPSSLSATVPGAEFPAVSGAAFPAATPFALTAPDDPGVPGAIDRDTVFTWSGSMGEGNAVVLLNIMSVGLEDLTFVNCFAVDTGSFTFPEDTRSELGEGFSGNLVSAERQALRVQAVGDAQLVLAVSRGQVFEWTILLPPTEDTGDF